MQVIIIIIMMVSVCFANDQERHFNNTPDVQDCFYKIGEDILDTAKNIFKIFNITKHLTESPKVKMLLTMHSDLKRIIQINYEMYDKIKNASKVTTDNKNISRYLNLNGLTSMLYIVRLQKFKKNTNHTVYMQQKQSEDNTTAEFKDKKEMIDFVNSFAAKISTLTVNDLFKPSNYTRHDKNAVKRKQKYWRPEAANDESPLSNITRRIYKGQTAKANKYSFMASIHVDDRFVCSGSMIGLNLIITAASCLKFEQIKRESAFVHIGSDYLKEGGIFVSIEQVYFHPLYNPKNLRNNLAIIKMKTTSYDPTEIKRIKLDKNNAKLTPNDQYQIVVLGWGAIDESRTYEPTHQLRTAKLDMYNLEDCADIYSSQYVTEKHFCAGFTTKGGGACNKDVGGPGIKHGVLVGVISFGPAICGNAAEPTVFIRIGSYIAWITEIINQVGQFPSSQKSVQKSIIPNKSANLTTIIPKINNYYQNRQNSHRNAKYEAISIVKEIINEIVLTNDNKLDETLYKDLYEDFNELYLKSLKVDEDELDQSIDVLDKISDEDSEYNDEPTYSSLNTITTKVTTLPFEIASDEENTSNIDTDTFQDKDTTPKPDSLQSPLLSMASDSSADISDNDEISENYDDEFSLNIDMPNTEEPGATHFKMNNDNHHETTDMWGIPDVFFFWDVNNQDSTPNALKHTTNASPTSKIPTQSVTDTQSGRIGKAGDISDDEYDYDNDDSGLGQREPMQRAEHVTHMS